MKGLIALALLAAGATLALHSSTGDLALPDYRNYLYEERAATANTFVQFYPTLIETAKQHGTYKERSL